MIVKTIAGKVYGADLNTKEREAMRIEIRKEIAEEERKHVDEVDAIVLWILYEEFGFREKRLKQFHDRLGPEIQRLLERYELGKSDTPWLCTKKLLDHGIDIRKWNEEVKE